VGDKLGARIGRCCGCLSHAPAGNLELTFSDIKSGRIYVEIDMTCVSRRSRNPRTGPAAGIEDAQPLNPPLAQLIDCLANRVPDDVVGVSEAAR